MWTFELLVVALMIAFNSIFASYEIALASIGLGRLHALAAENKGGAAAALRMKEKMEASLAVVQLGITLVGAIAAATSGAGAEELLEPRLREWGLSAGAAQFGAIALVVAPLTVVTILFGELVPKVFALRNKEWVCLKLSPPMEWFSYTVWPAVWFFENSVAWIMALGQNRQQRDASAEAAAIQDLRGAASLARITDLIGPREEGIIDSATRLARTPLRRIMLPARYIGMLHLDQPLRQALQTSQQGMHTRYPVTEKQGDPQQIIGYVNVKDIVNSLQRNPSGGTLNDLLRPIPTFPANRSVADCLEQLMRERQHIALVRNGNKRIVGLITLEDIIEEIIGEIHDEFDRLPSHLRSFGEGWLAGGFVSLSQLRITTEIDLQPLDTKPILTINDWILEYLGRPPAVGDVIDEPEFHITVRRIHETLVHEAYIEAKPLPEAPPPPPE